MLKPKVSIITVVRNAKEELIRTIENVTNISYENIEYIIVDGASTDGTREVIESNSLNISQWISEPDKGIYDAMNKGIAMATGDYIWFLNAGDMADSSDVLSNIFSGVEQPADIYYGDTIILSEKMEVLGLRGKRLPRRLTLKSFRYGMSVCHQSILVRRKIAPRYDLRYRYASDIDWVMRSIERSESIVNCRMVISRFVEGGISSINRRKSLQERYNIMVSYYGKVRTLLYHIIIVMKSINPKYRKIKREY